jgi:hypothetical protein
MSLAENWSAESRPAASEPAVAAAPAEAAAEEKGPSWLSQIGSTFGEELTKLRGLAVGATLGVLRDMLTTNAPEPLRPQLAEVMDGLTTKLGGKPFKERLLDTDTSEERCQEKATA